MKRTMIALAVLTTVSVLAGCGSRATVVESGFFTAFSLGSIIEANQQFLSTPEIASGGTMSGPAQPFFQRREEAIVQIEASEIPAFMQALQAGIESALADSGAKIVGSGTARQGPGVSPMDIVEFDLWYSSRKVKGIVNVWGVRGQGTSLIVIASLTEGSDF